MTKMDIQIKPTVCFRCLWVQHRFTRTITFQQITA